VLSDCTQHCIFFLLDLIIDIEVYVCVSLKQKEYYKHI